MFAAEPCATLLLAAALCSCQERAAVEERAPVDEHPTQSTDDTTATSSAAVSAERDAQPPDSVAVPAESDAEPLDSAVVPTERDAQAPAKAISPVTFARQVLSQEFVAEGATLCDIDLDGALDVVAGADWYRGPEHLEVHPFRPHQVYDPVDYSDTFGTFCHDFDRDGWLDVLIMGFPGQSASWYQNPQGASGEWARHDVFEPLDNEAPTFVDLTGDGLPELVMNSGGYFGWAGPDPADPTLPFVFHPISVLGSWGRFTHGLGIGDVDSDGRKDVLDSQGYWRQPSELAGDPVWERQPAVWGEGGAQMFTYDVDDDGDQDVITSLQAHGQGVLWYEQLAAAGDFTPHLISGTSAEPGSTSVLLHEPHALALVDIDGDGLEDILTGERFWGHAPATPAERDLSAPALLVWFGLTRDENGAHYTAYTIDDQSGVGVQVVARPLEDGRMAVVVANKKGVFLFRRQ